MSMDTDPVTQFNAAPQFWINELVTFFKFLTYLPLRRVPVNVGRAKDTYKLQDVA